MRRNRIVLVINGAIHEECTHEAELGSLKGFRKNIRPHVFSGTILKVEFSCVVKMTNEEGFCFDVLGSFRLYVQYKYNYTLYFLRVYNIQYYHSFLKV